MKMSNKTLSISQCSPSFKDIIAVNYRFRPRFICIVFQNTLHLSNLL